MQAGHHTSASRLTRKRPAVTTGHIAAPVVPSMLHIRSRPSQLPSSSACKSGYRHHNLRSTVSLSASAAESVATHVSGAADEQKVNDLKLRLLSAVASLDRGLAANGRDAQRVDELVTSLEQACGPAILNGATLQELPGMWRLVYTSGFNTGSLGGRRPGPPAAIVPTTLGQVYQRINSDTGRLDNIVEFLFTAGLPSLDNLLGSKPEVGRPASYPESPAVRLTLKHDYQLQGTNTVEIVFEDTSAELVGNTMFASLPKFDLPQLPEALRPPRGIRSATFDVVFLDHSMRITRGDRQELRIYLRDE